MALLTKSKYMNGLQCPKLLWRANKKSLPEITLSDEHRFEQGHEFEEYVKKIYPEHVDLNKLEFKENLKETQNAIKKGNTIFEAGFIVDDLFIRADLMIPTDKGWDLYEIKSTTKLKPQHIPDLAFQKFVIEKTGLKINKCFVMHLNKSYTKNGRINPEELTAKEEVTEEVNSVKDIELNISKFKKIMKLSEYDESPISQNCNKPYICPLKQECWATLPENNVLHLTNWRVYWKLFSEGVYDIQDIPQGTPLNLKDESIIKSLKANPYVSQGNIRNFLNSLNYPLYHFDFETFDTAVPIFNQAKPYQKIPFQYSLHIEEKNGSIEHREFLADGHKDPRPDLLKQMKKDLGQEGDIVVFNKSFEISVMKNLAEDFPEHKDWLMSATDRIVDLADPFRAFHYYNKSQKGSYSIKKVLPAITGKSYSELEINNGSDASMLYFYSHIKEKLKNKEEIREDLLEYCNLDTEGMVWIIDELRNLINK
jgi:Domain of unknown function(DUF2779)